MKLNKALQRLQWRFSEAKQFQPNENDIEALNAILQYFNNESRKAVQENSHFAKLYIYTLTNEMIFYNGDMDFAQRKINKILENDLEAIYGNFRSKYNAIHFNNFLIENGLSKMHPMTYSEKEAEVNRKLTNHPEWENYAKGILEDEENIMQLNWLITLTLNKFRNV